MKKMYKFSVIGIITILFSYSAVVAQIVYVKQGGTGAGTSWADATGNLQAAIDATGTTEVRVAAGTYEAGGSDNNIRGFVMKNNVAIYGGFPATGTPGMNDRNWKVNETILTGNNTHRVIYNNFTDQTVLNGSAVLDGFSIKNGKSTGGGATGSGGGIYNNYASPSLNNLVISNNSNDSSSPTADGGGVFNNYWSSPTLTNVEISNNTSTKNGGGMMSQNDSAPTLYNVLIANNTCANKGGGLINIKGSFPVAPTYINVTIVNNKANFNGDGGGGLWNNPDANPKVYNTIIWGNKKFDNANSNVVNSSATPSYKNSIVQGSGGSGAWVSAYGTDGGNNLDTDPKFFGVNDFSLQTSSPAINTGDNTLYPGLNGTTKDLANNTRLISSNIDRGAYEFQSVLPVDLLGYSVKTNGNYAVLQWKTANETNNKGFDIYRSGADKVFVKIAEVFASANASLAINNYTFTDKQPLNGNNYYKLVQVDNNGTSTELGIKNVNFNLSSSVTVYPNPTNEQTTISFDSGKYNTLELIGQQGKVLNTYPIGQLEGSKTINLTNKPAGLYILKLKGAAQTDIKKVVKQ